MLRPLMTALVLLVFALPLRAAPAEDLIEALKIEEMLAVMREEGLVYGRDMALDMFPGGSSAQWERLVSEIYDTEKMGQIVRAGFSKTLEGTPTAPLLAYFTSPQGREVVGLELSARKAMVDDAVEETARDAFRALEGGEDARLKRIEAFIEANDLVEANVEGALNASFQFYRGLVDGGGFEMSEGDMLADVWAQEEETRADTREWLYGFLLMAYGPLSDADLDAYIALSESPEGQVLNRALFAGFNRMYEEISYALGLAAAQQMKAQEL